MYVNGSSYQGGWNEDKKNGRGRLIDKLTGNCYIGEYLEGNRVGNGRMFDALK